MPGLNRSLAARAAERSSGSRESWQRNNPHAISRDNECPLSTSESARAKACDDCLFSVAGLKMRQCPTAGRLTPNKPG